MSHIYSSTIFISNHPSTLTISKWPFYGLDACSKEKTAFQRDGLPNSNSYVEHEIQEEEVFVDHPKHSPHLQTFMHDSFNQEMITKLIQINPNTFLVDLFTFGARLSIEFDRTILDTPSSIHNQALPYLQALLIFPSHQSQHP